MTKCQCFDVSIVKNKNKKLSVMETKSTSNVKAAAIGLFWSP